MDYMIWDEQGNSYLYDEKNPGNRTRIPYVSENAFRNLPVVLYYRAGKLEEGTTVAGIHIMDVELLEKRFVTGLKTGDSYRYEPEPLYGSELRGDSHFTGMGWGGYGYCWGDPSQRLNVSTLSRNPDDNDIFVYYFECLPGSGTTISVRLRDAQTGEVLWVFEAGTATGLPVEYDPEPEFLAENGMRYYFDKENPGNCLKLEKTVYDYAFKGKASTNLITAYYRSVKQDVSSARIKVKKAVYNGKKQRPDITVTCNGQKLEKGKDYKTSYRKNRKVGKAFVTIQGIGAYSGEKTQSFVIRPGMPKIKQVTYEGTGKAVVRFKKVKGASGYQVSYGTSRKFTSAKKKGTAKTCVTLKKLARGRKYYVKVRAYVKVDGKKIYGGYGKRKEIL